MAELLISLLILGEIATFTIPKILDAQQISTNKAKAKEGAAMISEAYQLYKARNQVTSSFSIGALTPYLNYVKTDTSTVVDVPPYGSTITCGTMYADCLRLHNGSMLRYYSGWTFSGTSNNHAVWFDINPDAGISSSSSGAAVQFFLYYNGKLRTFGTIDAGTCSGGWCTFNPTPANDPSWFSW